ncbi:MAG: Fic family protein [Solirubrobacterales bacterium]
MELIDRLSQDELAAAVKAPPDTRAAMSYLHWDKLRRLKPPKGLTSEQWWLQIKSAREAELRAFPLSDPKGMRFRYGVTDDMQRSLHLIDQRGGGEVAMEEVVTSDAQARNRYLVNSLTEEAIRSSQLEGATTSRRVAKELLRSGRQPRDRSERMIVNNYRAIQFMREEMGGELNPSAVLELHEIVTEGTLDDPSAAGRLQVPGERRVAVYNRDGDARPVHKPPPAEQLPERLAELCEFANEEDDGTRWVHPVIRAILLHFWLAYDHPFLDGNGRTARILFFWAMRARGYWLAEYLPISRIIRLAPAQYGRAFAETETDGGDTTYFLIHQLNVIKQGIKDVYAYVERKTAEVRDIERLLQKDNRLNGRQLALLTDAIRHPSASYTFEGHAASHRVTHETARADLRGLAGRNLLVQRQKGRKYIFEPAPDLPKRLKESPA